MYYWDTIRDKKIDERLQEMERNGEKLMEIKFEDIKKANDSIITTDIKGKDYAEVNQRIKAFRMVYPQGAIVTDLVSDENGVCICKAIVQNEEGFVIGTGHAYEKEGSTFINKTSYIENCETSAVGRALGMAGFGIDTSVASAEEVQNAIKQQEEAKKKEEEEKQKPITKKLEDALLLSIENNNMSDEQVETILKQFGYTSTKEILMKDYMNVVNGFKNAIK